MKVPMCERKSLPLFFFSQPTLKQNLYICMTTIKGDEMVINKMVASLPEQFNYIVIYSNEPEEKYEIVDDKRINVYIKNNIYEYGTWVGVNYLIVNKVVNGSDWFLFTHDTTEFGPRSRKLICSLLAKYADTDINLVWLESHGRNNICLIRNDAITKGADKYKDVLTMDKREAMQCEFECDRVLSPKSIQTSYVFELDTRAIHNGSHSHFTSIDLKKYYRRVDFLAGEKHSNVPY